MSLIWILVAAFLVGIVGWFGHKRARFNRARRIIDHLVRLGADRNPAGEMVQYSVADLEWAFEFMSMFIENQRATWLAHTRDELRPLLLPLYLAIKQIRDLRQRQLLKEIGEQRQEIAAGQPTISDPHMRDPISSLTAFIMIGVLERVLASLRIAREEVDHGAAGGEKPEVVALLRRWLVADENDAIRTAKVNLHHHGLDQSAAEELVDGWLSFSRMQERKDPMYIVQHLRPMWTTYLDIMVRSDTGD